MAVNCLFRNVKFTQIQQIARCHGGGGMTVPQADRAKIGKRLIVGFGINGRPEYIDRIDYPFPAIRFKEDTPDIQVLREKEKGDWHKLSIEEKKTLYRASFRQTVAEMGAITGEWKAIIGYTLIFASLGIWMFIGTKLFIYPPLPDSFSPENQKIQLQRMLDLKMNPILGIASQYDYENKKWK